MVRIRLVSVALIFFILIGCQNNNLNLSGEVTSIDVYEWDNEELIATIDDKEFIKELVLELDNAKTASTANMNFKMPDYKLLFKDDEEVIYEIGYYKKVVKLGIEGQYWEFDKMYGVNKTLPID